MKASLTTSLIPRTLCTATATIPSQLAFSAQTANLALQVSVQSSATRALLTLVPPTLNLPGPVQALRLKYRNKVNYGGRFAVIKTSGFKSEKAANDTRYGTPKENEFIAMLPLNVFLKLMANPTELADRLTVSVEKLMAE